MSLPPPRLLLLAPAARRQPLEAKLRAGLAASSITSATPETASDVLGERGFDLVVLAAPAGQGGSVVGQLARLCAPAPIVLLGTAADDAGDAPGVAVRLEDEARLAEVVGAHLPRHVGRGSQHLQEILGRVADPLLLVDAAGTILAVNTPFSELFGWPDADLAGRHLAGLLPATIVARVRRAERHEWTAEAVAMHVRGVAAPSSVNLRASAVRLAGGRATWLLRVPPAPAHRVSASPDAASGAIDDLTRRAQRAGTRVGGAHVRLIGLGRARQILGGQWPRFKQHIGLVCESTIEHELGAQDVAMATASGDYLVCFACDDDGEADRRADRLQATIDRRLFGEEGGELGGTARGREALASMSVEVEAAVLPSEADPAPEYIADRFARECAARRRERLAEFNHRLEELGNGGDLELLPVASARGVLPSLVRAHWFPPDYARLQRLAERANRMEELRLTLDLRRLALLDTADSDGVFDTASVIVDLHITTIERRKSWDALLPVIQDLAGSTRRWLVPNLVGIPSDVYPGRLRDAVVTLKPFSRTQTMTLGARQLASLDLTALPCRLFVITAAEAAGALDSEWPARIRERLELAKAKLAIDGGSASLAAAFGAGLRTVRDVGEPRAA